MCQKESHVTDEEIAQALTGDFGNNLDKLKAHSFCIVKHYGFINDAGDLLIDNIKKSMSANVEEQEKADMVVSKCVVQKDAPLETAWAFSTCLISIMYT